MVELTGGNIITCKPVDMTSVQNFSMTLWFKVGDITFQHNLVELSPVINLFIEPFDSNQGKLSFQPHPSYTKNATDIKVTVKWNYLILAHNITNFTIMMNNQKAQNTAELFAPRRYFIQKPQFIFGEKAATSNVSFAQFILYNQWVEPNSLIGEMFNLRDTVLKYNKMLRYFKFERVNQYNDNGDILIDSSDYKEHCVIFDPAVWKQDNILGNSLLDFLNDLFPPPNYGDLLNSHVTFKYNGPVFTGSQAPKRISDYDDGFTVEFWFYFNSKPTGTFLLDMFTVQNNESPGVVSVSFDDSEGGFTLQYFDASAVFMSTEFASIMPLTLKKWYFLSFTVNLNGLNARLTIMPETTGTWTTYSATNKMTAGTILTVKSFHTMKFMQCTGLSSDCAAMNVSVAEIRLWDTYRLIDPIMALSKVNLTRLYLPAVVSYWRMIYELGNKGRAVYDYSINQNTPYELSPVDAYWDTSIPWLKVCNHTFRFVDGNCVDQSLYPDDKVIQQMLKFAFVNSSFVFMNTTKSSFATWEWTADFWMLKDNENDNTLLFFIGPEVDKNDYGDNQLQYPTMFTELRNSNMQTAIDLHCENFNFHVCEGDQLYDCKVFPLLTDTILNCTSDFPINNSTHLCTNDCLFSKNCDNICNGVTGCRTFCNDTGTIAGDYCSAEYSNSNSGQFTCVGGMKCIGSFVDNSHEFFVDCSLAQQNCQIEVIDSGNSIIPTAENTYSIQNQIKCSNSQDCSVDATNTKDLFIDCSLNNPCTVSIINSDNQKVGTFYSANIVLASQTTNSVIYLEKVSRSVVACHESLNCDIKVLEPLNFNQASCSADPIFHKIDVSNPTLMTTGQSKVYFDQTASASKTGFAIINCQSSNDCLVDLISGPEQCPYMPHTQIIDCQSATKCFNTVKDTYQIAINCKLSQNCQNRLDNSISPSMSVTTVNFVQIDCTLSPTICNSKFNDVNVFQIDCTSAIYCRNMLTGSTATTTVDHSATKATYSKIDCSQSSYCYVDMKNGATNVHLNLFQAKATPGTPHKIFMQDGSERQEIHSSVSYVIYPVIDAAYSENLDIDFNAGIDAYVNCGFSLNCKVTFLDSIRDPQLQPTQIVCASSKNCDVSLTNNPAGYVNCKSATDCTVSIKDSKTTYPTTACSTVSPTKTHFNLVDCSNSISACSVTLDNAIISYVKCNTAINCIVNILNNPAHLNVPSCSGSPAISQVDCTGATNCAVAITDSISTNTKVICRTVCLNSYTNVLAVKNGVINSKYLFVDCISTSSCTNSLTDVDEFYVDCTSTSTLCKNTITSSSVLTYTQYSDPLHSEYSFIFCSGAAPCENSVDMVNPISITCQSSTSCVNSLTSLTAYMKGIYKVYPVINCKQTLGTCTNTITNTAAITMTGVQIDCSNLVNSNLCSNNLQFIDEFYIRCWTQPCTNIVTQGAKKVVGYDGITETQYSIIECSKTCTNTMNTVSQVFIYCVTAGSQCTNTFTSSSIILPDTNFPYVYCKSLTTGSLCKNSFASFKQIAVDCSSSANAVCDTTLTNAIDGAQGDSYINYVSTTGAKVTCSNTPYCFVDCQGANTCDATSENTNNPSSFPTTTLTPILNMKSSSSSTATCTSDSDCLIYAQSSTSGTFTISSGVSSPNSYSVIYANLADSPSNTCDNAPDCYIYCRNSLTSCTNKLINAASSITSYSVIDCKGTATCTNLCQNQIQCYIDCTSAPTCVNQLTNIPAAGMTNTLLPSINCRSSDTCTNTITNSMGGFVDCSAGTGVCTTTITNSLATTAINHVQCKNGLAGSSCTASISGSSRVMIDCGYSKSCLVDIDSSNWVEVQCRNSLSCTVNANNVDNLNVQCQNSVSCIVKSTDTINSAQSNHEVNCNNGGVCRFEATAVNGLKFACDDATVSCTVIIQRTTSNQIYLRQAASPSLTCTVIAAFTYSGSVYTLTYPVPTPSCNSLNQVLGMGSPSLTWFSHFNAQYTRNILTSIVPYKAAVTLTGGYPDKINSFTTRQTNAQSILNNKPLARMTKTTFFVPKKISYTTFYPSSVYNYQMTSADYKIPPFAFGTPPSMTIPGNILPILNLPVYGIVTPNLTLPGTCERILFTKQHTPSPTNVWSYAEKYQYRTDYKEKQWNHIVLQTKDNDFTICINGFCRDDNLKYSQITAPNITLQKEMRFFYNYLGKIGEFKIWKGDQIRTAIKLRGSIGPYSLSETLNLVGYYRFLNRSDINIHEKYTFFDSLRELDYSQQSPKYIDLHENFTLALADLETPNFYDIPSVDFYVCQDGRYSTGNKGCSTLNAVMRANNDQTSMKLYQIDFERPPEFSISFWYNGGCLMQPKDCIVIDGPFIFSIDQNSEIVRSKIAGQDITVTLTSQSQKWIQVTQSVWNQGGLTYYRLLISNKLQSFLNTGLSPLNGDQGIPVTFVWPVSPLNWIYIGTSIPAITQSPPNLKVKSYMFLRYKLSKNEHLMLPHSEYIFKRVAMFYFSMNDGKFAGITNGLTPEGARVSMAQAGFIWERDLSVPLLCQENGDSIYDNYTTTCIDKKTLKINNYASNTLNLVEPVIKLDNMLNLASSGILPHSQDFTVSFFAWIDFFNFPSLHLGKKSTMILMDSPVANEGIEIYFQQQQIPAPPAFGGTIYNLLLLHLHQSVTFPAFSNQCYQQFPNSNNLSPTQQKLGTTWTLVTLIREQISSTQIQATLKFDNSISITCISIVPSVPSSLPTYNQLQIFPNLDPAYMMARIRHLRIYGQAVFDTETQIFDRYFDMSHTSTITTWKKYFPLDNYSGQLYQWDMKSDSNLYNLMGESLDATSDALNTAQDDLIDDYFSVYQAVKISAGTNSVVNNLKANAEYKHWTIEFMFSADSNPQLPSIPIIDIDQLVKISFEFQTGNKYYIKIEDYAGHSIQTSSAFDIMIPNNLTHVQINTYNDPNPLIPTIMLKVFINGVYVFYSGQDLNPIQFGVAMQLWVTDLVYFRFVRIWNVYVKPYPLMQIRNKIVNYFLHKDRLLLFYDISHNSLYQPYRVAWFNRQLMVAEDDSWSPDTNHLAPNSNTNIIYNNICLANQTYDQVQNKCMSEYYLPLSASYANQIILPLEEKITSGQTDYRSFVLGFWALLKENKPAGHFMRLDFDQDYYFQEDSLLQLNLLMPPTVHQISTDVQRQQYDRKVTFKTSWHYIRMTYNTEVTPAILVFHIDSKIQNQFTTIPFDFTVTTKPYNIELCPKVPGVTPTAIDCDTVIAHLKLWFDTTRRFIKQCDYRLTLEPNIYLQTYWPLVRNTNDQVGEVEDLGPAKRKAKINYQGDFNNGFWVTISEVSIHEAEKIITCDLANSFDDDQDIQQSKIDDNSIAIYKAFSHLQLNLTHWDTIEETVEYTVEFWFKFDLSEMNSFKYPNTLKVAEHDTACIPLAASGFKLELLHQSIFLNEGKRNAFVHVYEGPSILYQYDYSLNNEELKKDTWYHFAIVNNHKDEQIEVYVDFKKMTTPNYRLNKLTQCPFYLGDDTGSTTTFFDDSTITVRELRTWNEARTFGQLKFFSNRGLPNDTINLRSYYKLNEFNFDLFERTSNRWLNSENFTATVNGIDFVKYVIDKRKFSVDCSPGFVGGERGCSPASDWIQNPTNPVSLAQMPAQVTFDIGSAINDRIQQKDVQITIALQIKPQYNHASNTKIFSIENFLDLRRIDQSYQITMFMVDSSLNDLVEFVKTPPTPTVLVPPLPRLYPAGEYQYLFIMVDLPAQSVKLINQMENGVSEEYKFDILPGLQFRSVDPIQYLIIGDQTPTVQNFVAISQIQIFTKVLSDLEIKRIVNLGIRIIPNLDSQLMNQFNLASNQVFDTQTSLMIDGRTFYVQNMEKWPSWIEDFNQFEIFREPRKIQFCPEGMSLKFNYSPVQQQYSYCQQRSAFTMRNQVQQTLNIQPIKQNVRYAWTVRQRFRFLNIINSAASPCVDLIQINKIFTVSALNETALNLTLYNMNGSISQIYTKILDASLGQEWHELTASLFNFTWTYYLDGSQIYQTPDIMLYYNMSTQLGDKIVIDLSKSTTETVLQVADVAVWGIPFTHMETSLWSASANLNVRQLEGILLTYYDLSSQPFSSQAYDLSMYGMESELTPIPAGAIDDWITWSYESNNQIYQASPLVNVKNYPHNYHHLFSKDKTLRFKHNGGILITDKLRFDSEFTIEMCYYLKNIQTVSSDTLLQIDGYVGGVSQVMTTLHLDNSVTSFPQLMFTPFHTNMTNIFSIFTGYINQWNCITAAASFEKSQIYVTNFFELRNEGDKANNYAEYLSGAPFMTTALETIENGTMWVGPALDGSIRELRVWSTYLSPALARRYYRAMQLSYHNNLLAGYWPMNDGYGDILKEYVYGNHTFVNQDQHQWIKFTSPNENLEICEGENVFSEGGYCLNREKFLKLRSGYAPLQFTIKNGAGEAQNYNYELMSHSTIVMWICIKQLSVPKVKPTRTLFTLQIKKRYTVNINEDEKLQLDSDAINPKTIVSGVDFSKFYDSWGFISIGCSKLTTYCEVHRGQFMQNYELFKSKIDNNGIIENRMYHNDMLKWGNLTETNVSLSGPIEGHRFQMFLKEFQVYQVLLPYQAILLKVRGGITSKLFPSLIVHLKMDEYSGTRLYNHAYDTKNSFAYIDVEAVSWHHFPETVLSSSPQYSDPIKYMFCYKENYTYVGDHCEYFQCHADCSKHGRTGHCTGWTNSECIYLETKGTNITYDAQYNDYLSCYKHCTECKSPFSNQNCLSCLPGSVLYNDKKGLFSVANGSCWEFCPISTFEQFTISGQRYCKDCPPYCFCDGITISCPGCMNSTFLFDKKSGVCFKECPPKTFYSQYEQTCLPCSSNCANCTGPFIYDCTACEKGLIMFKTTEGFVCDNNKCQKGFYYDEIKSSCQKCSEECAECEGPTNLHCKERCSYSYIKVSNSSSAKVFKCISCIEIASQNEKYQNSYNDKREYCDEVCGDGFNMKINECDDGNRIDKDGCTSDCRIERGYRCRGGSPISMDKCQRILPILGEAQVKVDSTINSEKGSLVIEFDEKVKVNPIHVKDIKEKIKVFLNGTCEKTDLKYTIDIIKDKQGYETVKISYNIDFNVPEKSKCMINAQFQEKGLFIARDGSLVNQKDFQPVELPPFQKFSDTQMSIQSAADKIESIMLSFLIANLVVGFVMGDGMTHMWFLINQLQIIYYIPLMNIKFHSFAQFVFKLLAFAIADFFEFIPQYFEVILDLKSLSDKPYNDRYLALEMENTYITTGYYQKLAVFILMLILYPIAYAGTKISNKYVSLPFRILYKTMTFGFPLQFLFELYLELSVIIWVAIMGLSYSNFAQLFSSVLAILIFMVVTVVPIYSYSKIMDSFEQFHDIKFREKFLPLVESTKIQHNSTICQMWTPIFLFRRFTYAAILCILQDIPIMQICLCLIQSALQLGFLIKVRPFESWDLNFVSIFYELSILVAFLTSILFMHDYSENEGVVISYILTAVIVIDVGLAMLFLMWDMYKKLKKISIRILTLCAKFKNMIQPNEPKKQQQITHSEQSEIESQSAGTQQSIEGKRLQATRDNLIQRDLTDMKELGGTADIEATNDISAQISRMDNVKFENKSQDNKDDQTDKVRADAVYQTQVKKKKKTRKVSNPQTNKTNAVNSLIQMRREVKTSDKDIAEIMKKYEYTLEQEQHNKQQQNHSQIENDSITKYFNHKSLIDSQLEKNV